MDRGRLLLWLRSSFTDLNARQFLDSLPIALGSQAKEPDPLAITMA